MVNGDYEKPKKRYAPKFQYDPPARKVTHAPKFFKGKVNFTLKYECDGCGMRVSESTKACQSCGRVNPDYLKIRFGIKMKE